MWLDSNWYGGGPLDGLGARVQLPSPSTMRSRCTCQQHVVSQNLRRRVGLRKSFHSLETVFAEYLHPCIGFEQRMFTAQFVGTLLPAFDKSHGDVEPRQVFGNFVGKKH